MADFFNLTAEKNENYIRITNELDDIKDFCRDSEFQFFTREERTVELEGTTGNEWPDFMYEKEIPLVSKRFKEFLLEENGVDYFYYKKMILKKSTGEEKEYWLALPPRIESFHTRRSEIDKEANRVIHFFMNPRKYGYFEIFKCADVVNEEIAVIDSLAEKIKAQDFKGVILEPLP